MDATIRFCGEPVLVPSEIAKILGMTPENVTGLIRRKKIKALTIANRHLVPISWFEDYLKKKGYEEVEMVTE